MSESVPTKRRRRAVSFVSPVDEELLRKGLQPSWEDRVSAGDRRPGSFADSPDIGDGANDARLLENVPPHSQARA
ncbi:toxin [Schaalia sp. ZJ405]|uniref:toxin n=1 Tax=Schaalia sp. ZJ405 TaxID=2709403 RepID=UPI0013EC1EAC|nr:toxin [Schaalia sp. ZJ405]QPK82320.1 toxin [Schaalia sp. ZJ405]